MRFLGNREIGEQDAVRAIEMELARYQGGSVGPLPECRAIIVLALPSASRATAAQRNSALHGFESGLMEMDPILERSRS
jgi:hypothetical protein